MQGIKRVFYDYLIVILSHINPRNLFLFDYVNNTSFEMTRFVFFILINIVF